MVNGTMMQYFHWYYPADGSLWRQVKEKAEEIASLGITALWLPPAYKGKEGSATPGYDVYDLFDLGEFDQKGSVRTKYGTKEEYAAAVKALHENGIQVITDVVLNHKAGADEKEKVRVIRVNPENRNEFLGDAFEIEAFTKFTFPGRGGKYSQFIWDYTCFTGVDYASDTNEKGVFKIENDYAEGWENVLDEEKGNYDFLMFDDIEFRNPAVREELRNWGAWYLKEIPFEGVRLDAVKHIAPEFYNEWLDYMRSIKPDMFAVGEFWAPGELPLLLKYIEVTEGRMSLFDAPLHQNFHDASRLGSAYNLSTIYDNSLVAAKPELSVTIIDNHDTQPLQALESPVEAWFKPLAYALILLREEGYPCVFYPDLYGAHYNDKGKDGSDCEIFLEICNNLDKLITARNRFAYGRQRNYFDHPNCIGWTREGIDEHNNSGCAVVMSNSEEGYKDMEVGKQHAGKIFVDYLKNHPSEVTVNEDGWGRFGVPAGSVSVWVIKNV